MKIIIADDHAIVRKGVIQLLLEKYPFAIIDEASNAEELINNVLSSIYDVAICDINMPGRSGLGALVQLKQIRPEMPVLIMSMYPEEQYAVRVIKAGAAGFLGKETIHDDLVTAIEMVRKGKKFITSSIAEKLATAVSSQEAKLKHETLSDREFDVFKLLATGKTITEIAMILSLSATTVSTYRSRVMEKMDLKSNAELAHYAIEFKLI